MDIFSYADYRTYLRDALADLKMRRTGFSARMFAKMAGFGSHSYLRMIISGDRNITPVTINQISRVLKHGKKEAAYFEALVLFNQAKDDQDRNFYFERLYSLKPKVKLTGIPKDQYEYFTNKHFVIIREMATLPDFMDDPQWIAKRLHPPITPKEVEHALEVLVRLKLLKRAKDGKLVSSQGSLSTPSEVHSLEAYAYHSEVLNLAKEAMLKIVPTMRDLKTLTLPLAFGSLPLVKEKIQNFLEEIINLTTNCKTPHDEVFQISIQCFPVTKNSDKI